MGAPSPPGALGWSGRPRIRVLVVDDSAVIRKLVVDALSADPRIEVIGTAQNGALAVERVTSLSPDAVTMDIEMPVMNGIEAVRAIRRTHQWLPIIMFSTPTERGASATLDALSAGASDYVTKPSTSSFARSVADVRNQLIPMVKALTGFAPTRVPRQLSPRQAVADRSARTGRPGARPAPPASGAPASGPRAPRPRTGAVRAVVLGCSTGGPDALAEVLPALPATLPAPVLVVQHMPPTFTRLLAERLDATCSLTVGEAVDGDEVVAGRVLIAPGGRHMTVRSRAGGVVVALTDDPPENSCRPAADVLFRSAAAVYGDRLLSVVLTGMGRDGERGAERVRSAGGAVIAQDEATSVVWGMAGAVATAGLADRVLPLPLVAAQITATVTRPATVPAVS